MADDGRKWSEFEEVSALSDNMRVCTLDPDEAIEFDQNKTSPVTVLDLRWKKNDSVIRDNGATLPLSGPGKFVYYGSTDTVWTLPAGSSSIIGKEFVIINDAAGANKITLAFTGGDTLSSKLSPDIYGNVRVWWDGTKWVY